MALDTTGAGDEFHGALTLALASGLSARPACIYASAAAALECTRSGGVRGAPTSEELDNFLRRQNQD